MIEQMDQFILAWIEGIAEPLRAVQLAPMQAAPDGDAVLIRLLDSTPTLPPRNTLNPSLQIALCYLITVQHNDLVAAHALMSELIFNGLQNAAFRLDLEPVPLDLWALLDSPPQPAFRIRATVRRERPQRPVHPVLHPLRVEMLHPAELHGLILGPDDRPIMAALVELPDLGLYTRTDPNGRFSLPMVPGGDVALSLVITARGSEHPITVDAASDEDHPIVIHIDLVQAEPSDT